MRLIAIELDFHQSDLWRQCRNLRGAFCVNIPGAVSNLKRSNKICLSGGYTIWEATLIFILFQWRSTLKGKNLLP